MQSRVYIIEIYTLYTHLLSPNDNKIGSIVSESTMKNLSIKYNLGDLLKAIQLKTGWTLPPRNLFTLIKQELLQRNISDTKISVFEIMELTKHCFTSEMTEMLAAGINNIGKVLAQ